MRLGPAVAIATLIAGFVLRPAFPETAGVQFLSELTWTGSDPRVGGLSALVMRDGGMSAYALSDSGWLLDVDIDRTAHVLEGISVSKITNLVVDRAAPDAVNDSEGMAVGRDGSVFVSYERHHIIARFAPDQDGNAVALPADAFRDLGKNTGLEALAIDERGQVFTLPERPASKAKGFPVWRWDGSDWMQAFHLPARDGFWAVSAEFGPDGRFYLLERRLTFLGFQSRLRRWEIKDDQPNEETVLLTTPAGRFGNLEGVSLWRDESGAVRVSLISDNNYWPLMRMQLVEFVLTE